jgi:hypothetical protein
VKDAALSAVFAFNAEIFANAHRIAYRDRTLAVRTRDINRALSKLMLCHHQAPSCCDDRDDKTRGFADCSRQLQLESNPRQVCSMLSAIMRQRSQITAAAIALARIGWSNTGRDEAA